MPISPPRDLKSMIKRMLYVLPLFLPLYTLRFHLGPFPTTLLELYVLGLIGLFTYKNGFVGWKRGWERLGAWRYPVLAWFFVTLVSVFVAPDNIGGLGLWRAYVLEPLLVFVLMAEVLRDSVDLVRIRRHFFGVTIILAGWALMQFVTGQGIPHPWDVAIRAGRRATGPFPFPNALSLFAAPVMIWAFFTWLHDRADRLALVGWLAGGMAIALAKSQGAVFAVTVVAWLGLAVRKETRRFAVYGVLIALFAWLVTPSLRTALQREITFKGWSGQVRLFIWRESWAMLKDHPVMGAGFGGYPTVFKPYHKAKAIEIFQYPHTILFNFWSETGMFGVLVFGWIVATWIRLVYRASGWKGLLAGIAPLCVVLIHGLVDVPYFKNDLAIAFWMLAWAMTLQPEKSTQDAPRVDAV